MTRPGNVRRNTSRHDPQQQRAYARAWTTLSTAITNALDEGRRVGCVSMPGLYAQRRGDARDPQVKHDAELRELLCSSCPARSQCLAYADLAADLQIRINGHLPASKDHAA